MTRAAPTTSSADGYGEVVLTTLFSMI